MALMYCFQSVRGTSQVIQTTPLLGRLTVLHQLRQVVSSVTICPPTDLEILPLSLRDLYGLKPQICGFHCWQIHFDSEFPRSCLQHAQRLNPASLCISPAIFTISPSSRSNFPLDPDPKIE